MVKPTALNIRMYQVGFGDCFLLTFSYPDKNRHLLVDCGTKASRGFSIEDVATDVAKTCKNEPVVLVVTHRHQDHNSGFKGKAWQQIDKLDVVRCLQPWTEHPDLAADATGPALTDRHRHVAALAGLQSVAERIPAVLGDVPANASESFKRLHAKIRSVADNNAKNPEVIKNLQKFKTVTRYLSYGDGDPLADVLPGVTCRVLGPPTLEQADSLAYAKTSDQYWPLSATIGDEEPTRPAPPPHTPPLAQRGVEEGVPLNARWLRRRLERFRYARMLGIVTAVDHALNNTSIILLIRVGKQTLLFPGDAQLENWEYAQGQAGVTDELKEVTWYKVGHHGSHNATPRTIWNGFNGRGDKSLGTLLSTKPDFYNDVPKESLLRALDTESTLHTTKTLADDRMFEDVPIPLG